MISVVVVVVNECVVAKSAVVTAGGCSDEFLWP